MSYFSDAYSNIIADIIGASDSVEILIDDKDLDIINQICDLPLLSDQRLSLNLLITHENDTINQTTPSIKKTIKNISKNGWRIYEKQIKFSANALIVDRELIYLFTHNDKEYLIDQIIDEHIKTEIIYFIQNLVKNNTPLLFEDLLFSSIQQNAEKIIAISTEVWSEIIKKIADNPIELMKLNPRKFEELTAELLIREGMQVQLTRPTKDGGIDIFAEKETIFGRHLYLVECKHYSRENPVGVRIIRALYGLVEDKEATKGLIVTTSDFTRGVKDFYGVHKNRMDLKNYDSVVAWLERMRGNK